MHVWLPVAQTAPTHHGGTSRLLAKLEFTAQALRGSKPGPKGVGAGGEHKNTGLCSRAEWEGCYIGGWRRPRVQKHPGGSSVMGLLEEVGQEWEEKLEEKRGSDYPEEYPGNWVAPFCLF